MVGYITDKEGVILTCYHCNKSFNFRGDILQRRISCPLCHNSITMHILYEKTLRFLGRGAVKAMFEDKNALEDLLEEENPTAREMDNVRQKSVR